MRRALHVPVSRTAAAKFSLYVVDAALLALLTVQLLSTIADSIAPVERIEDLVIALRTTPDQSPRQILVHIR